MAPRTNDLADLISQLESVVLQMQATGPAVHVEQAAGKDDISGFEWQVEELEKKVSRAEYAMKGLKRSCDAAKVTLSVLRDHHMRRARIHNEGAEKYNRMVNKQTDLMPIHDTKTNRPISGFPKTLSCIQRMEDATLDRLLRSLHADYLPWTCDTN